MVKSHAITRPFLAILLFAIAGIAADDVRPMPNSEAAFAAIRKADQGEKAAKKTYQERMLSVKNTEIEELHVALKVASQKGDLDEANAIAALSKSTQAELAGTFEPIKPLNMAGQWITRADNQPINWTIAPSGVRHDKDGQVGPGIPTVDGNVMTIKWPDGWLNLLTFVSSDKFFLEGWKPGESTNKPASTVLVGVRNTQAK